jgi:cysteine desulfurase / selenocysteine lyase
MEHIGFLQWQDDVIDDPMPTMPDIRQYIGNLEEFPILRQRLFLNHAGVSPLCRAASAALRKYAHQAETEAYLAENWYAQVEQLRGSAAEMINATPQEVALVKNTSEGLAIVANGLDWQSGDVIVTTNVEYPANIYPWMEISRSRGAKLVMVEEEADESGRRIVPTEKILAAASDPRCKMVSLSHVEYASGQRHDLQTIGQFCRENGRLFCVDVIQSLGVVPIDVKTMGIDYLSADGHKWLLGPEGAGIFYCRRELVERTHPVMVGWMNVVNATDFGNYDYTLRSDAARFECGSWNVPGFLALKASLELLHSIGTRAIFDRLKLLTDRLIEGLHRKGYQVISPRGLERWSGIVSFSSPLHNHEQLWVKLRKEHRTELALREGRLRASPHFYNTEQQIDELLERLPGH